MTQIIEASFDTLMRQARWTADQKLDEAVKAVRETLPEMSDPAAVATLIAAHMQASTLDFTMTVLAQQTRASGAKDSDMDSFVAYVHERRARRDLIAEFS